MKTTAVFVCLQILFVTLQSTNKLSGAEEIAVAFTQEYSRVSYPLGNVGTLSKGSGSSKDTHTGVGRIRQRGLPLESMFRRRDHVAVILRATGFDRLRQGDSSNHNALSNIRTWRITRARIGLSSPASYLYKRGTIRQLSGIVQPRHHVYAIRY